MNYKDIPTASTINNLQKGGDDELAGEDVEELQPSQNFLSDDDDIYDQYFKAANWIWTHSLSQTTYQLR